MEKLAGIELRDYAKFSSNFLHAWVSGLKHVKIIPILMSREIELPKYRFPSDETEIRKYIPVRCYLDYLICNQKEEYIPQLIRGEKKWTNTL